ncbi:hypothetical protein B9Z55_005909 [Caenorhabditis nigoni]|uniref:F-box domain-containing protein n=2 Tax=Caenorhabditis nigoni TaxID=1611254 RepID=A0A2G5V2V6_9PELO|nr:hypothetical protein B9Z55_005909 [Caenorhabditis nigoni]
MFRQTEPTPVRLMTRKRKTIESTPLITDFFSTVKRERSQIETKQAVSQKLDESLEDTPIPPQPDYDCGPAFSLEALRTLLQVPLKPSLNALPDENAPVGLENMPKSVYSYIFTVLDMRSVSALSLVSTKMSSRVRGYVSTYDFYRRMQLDHLDFLNESFRPDDDEFLENDPFIACGALIKSITITLSTETRAKVFLNICRNLRNQLGGSLQGFGRMLETVTENWKFEERRIMIKAAILIDLDLRRALIKVLTAGAGHFVGLEMKVRSGLTQLFLTKDQDVNEMTPKEVIDFGAWLSILLRNVVEKHQGRLYYILFGPTRSSKKGEFVDWSYFCEEDRTNISQFKNEPNYKKFLTALLNGVRALRVMNNSKSTDNHWTGRKIYHMFLRVIEACEEKGNWSELASSMALSIDPSGLFSEYLVTCLDARRSDYTRYMVEAAEMVCLVRIHLYRWSSTPATFLAEPLHHAFDHLAQQDGHYDGSYKQFLELIWRAQKLRLKGLVKSAKNTIQSSDLIREELDGQLSMTRLMCEFGNTMILHQQGLQLPQVLDANRDNFPIIDADPHPLEEDEQLDEIP